jgi:hypothetical protein
VINHRGVTSLFLPVLLLYILLLPSTPLLHIAMFQEAEPVEEKTEFGVKLVRPFACFCSLRLMVLHATRFLSAAGAISRACFPSTDRLR